MGVVVLRRHDPGVLRLATDLVAPVEFNGRFGFPPIGDVQLAAAEEVLAGVLAAKEEK